MSGDLYRRWRPMMSAVAEREYHLRTEGFGQEIAEGSEAGLLPGQVDLWRVAGVPGETAFGGRVGRALGYLAHPPSGGDEVLLEFEDGVRARFTPHELFPYGVSLEPMAPPAAEGALR